MGTNLTWDAWEHLYLIQRERLRGSQRWTRNFVLDGFGLAGGVGLQVIVGQAGDNFAYVNGYEVKQLNQVALVLSPSTTNHVFLKFTKTPDITAGTAAITIGYEVNVTGIPPVDSIKLGEVDTGLAVVTAVRVQNNQYRLHDVQLDTDLEGRQKALKRVTFEKGTAFPTVPAPVAGEHFVRTDQPGNPEYIFNGTTWVQIGGAQGFQGSAGSGAQGAQGNQGMAGATGSTGSTGGTGPQGRQGWQGPAGVDGNQGAVGTGAQGPAGTNGSNGSNGAQGNQGNQGLGSNGAQGPAGVGGPQGNQGNVGTGAQGSQGSLGSQGSQGNQGFQGFQGLLSPDIYAATRVADPSGGGTDTTIAAAIAALPAPGGTIFIKGIHAVAATLVLPDKNIVFRGEGCGSAKINFSGVGALFSQANSNREFSIEHILLDGLSTAATQKVVDVSGSGVEVYLSNVMIVGFHDDIKDSGVGNEFILTHVEIVVPAFGTFDQKIYDGVASGEMVWNYVNVTFTEASDRFAFGGTDAVVGGPKWIVNHSYIGGPPPSITTFDVGQFIVTQFRVDNVVFFINGAYSNLIQLEAIDGKLNVDADDCIVSASSFVRVNGGVDPFIEPTGQELLVDGCNFAGAGLIINAILAASVRMKVAACIFDDFLGDAIRLGTGMSGAVEGCTFLNTAVPVRELFANAAMRYQGNEGFAGSIIIGEDSTVEGVRRKALTAVATTGGFVTQFEHFNRKGVVGIGTIKNTGANSLEVRETVTDAFGVTDSSTTTVFAGGDYMLDPQTNFGTARPPHISYKVEVRHPGAATTFSLRHATEGAE